MRRLLCSLAFVSVFAISQLAHAANVRAVMLDVVDATRPAANQINWRVKWVLVSLDANGQVYPAETVVNTATSDALATVQTKFVDAIVAHATSQGHTLQRTATFLIQYVQGS
jgi:hypothetical protein